MVNKNKMRLIFLYLTIILTGAAGMVVEFSAVRLVSPFFGSSMEVWATIIAVIIAALALGYYIGGWISRRIKYLTAAVYKIICLAGFFVGLSYLIVEPLVTFTSVA